MRQLSLSKRVTLRLLLAVTCLSFSVRAQDLERIYQGLNLRFDPPRSAAQAKSLLEGGNPKIDPELRRLVLDSRTKSLGAISADARNLAIPIQDNLIGIIATADSEAEVNALSDRIRREGGAVTAIVDEAVLARIPTSSIDRIGSDAALAYMGPQEMLSIPPDIKPARTAAKSIAVDGSVALTKANLLHSRGIRGAGVKIGILDFGFTGYRALQAQGALPAPKAVKAFGNDEGWDRVDTGSAHGAACAEIIHAMAPEAGLYLAAVGDGKGAGDDEIIQAAMWLADQHVDIISFSGGGTMGPLNGTALLDKLVEEVVGKGILWVNSAGNEGDSHWSGMTKLNSDKLVMVEDKPYLEIQATGPVVAAQVSWDDWGSNPLKPSSTQDFDVFLAAVDPATNNVTIVNASQNPQNGASKPMEIVAAESQPGQIFAVFIQAKSVNRSVRMHVFGLAPEKFVPNSPEGSLTIPATSGKALAVAAINAETIKLEPFSSQGPTDDGRTKPEIAAPDGVVSRALKGDFYGTSAACPHAAGFAALLKQMHGEVSPEALAKMVADSTSPLPDNRGAGRGMIDGGKISSEGLPGQPADGLHTEPGGLTRLLDLASDDNALGVKVVVGRPEYPIGDGLKIGYRANSDAYCILIHRSSTGESTTLLPRDGEQLQLQAGKRYAFPEDSGTTITITGPPGTDEVGIICSSSRLQREGIERVNRESLAVSVVRYKVVE